MADAALNPSSTAQRQALAHILQSVIQAVPLSDISLHLLAQAIPNHVWMADAQGQVDWFNDQVIQYSGRLRQDLIGSGWGQLVHPDDLDQATAVWQGAVRNGTNYEIEFRIRRHDGSYRWHLVRALPMRDDHGVVIRWVGSNTDIHDRKQAANASSRDHDRIWALSPVLKVIRGRDGFVQAVNPSWTRVLGWSAEETVGRHVFEFIHPDDHALVCDPFAGRELPERVVLGMRHASEGWRQIEWTAAFEDDTIFSFGRDITSERHASEALAVAQDALRQSQKMEAVGQLTGGIAHDFNNLLQGILSNLQLLRLRLDQGKPEGLHRYIDNASGAATRAASLTHRLLAFSRRQPLDPQVLDAAALIRSMEDLLRRTLGEQVTLSLTRTPDLWLTRCDSNQLENAVLNFVINARDAMPEGGKLVINLANVIVDEKRAEQQQGINPGDYVCISVSDSGEGMDASTLSRVFEPFFTTKPLGQGTGLGLSMIYGFARQSGGFVEMRSQVGAGTECLLFLPRTNAPVAIDVPDSPAASEKNHLITEADGKTILVVEDESVVREIVVDCLREMGYCMFEAGDGPGGLKIARELFRLDMLVTDVGLPGLNGRQVADEILELHPEVKVLFVTGYAGAAATDDFLSPGMAIMKKPFSLQALAARVREIMGNSGTAS